jgi:hypothetical protein
MLWSGFGDKVPDVLSINYSFVPISFILVEKAVLVLRAYRMRAFRSLYGWLLVISSVICFKNYKQGEGSLATFEGFDGKIRINKQLKIRITEFFLCWGVPAFIVAQALNLQIVF